MKQAKRNCYILIFCLLLSNLLIAQNFTIDISSANTSEVETKTYGFNSAYAPSYFIENCQNYDGYFSQNCTYVPTKCTRPDIAPEVASIEPIVLRFPGGTISSYYHFGNYNPINCKTNKKGYGTEFNEVFFLLGGTIGQQLAQDLQVDRNHIFNFIDLIKEIESITGRPVEVNYVVNLLSHFKGFNHGNSLNPGQQKYQKIMAENMAAIDLLISSGVPVKAVELDNELYFGHYTNFFRHHVTVNKYNKLATEYSQEIKTTYPNIKTAVVLPFAANNPWSQYLAANNEFDALVVHKYYKAATEISTYDFIYNGFFDKLNAFNNTLNTDKEIWLTEWNAVGNESIVRTFEHSAFVLEFMLEMQAYNANATNPITHANFHNLLAGSGPYVVFNALNNQISREPVYNAFDLLSFVFNQKDPISGQATNVDFIDNMNVSGLNDSCHVHAVISSDENLSIFYSNQSDDILDLDINNSTVSLIGSPDVLSISNKAYVANSLNAITNDIVLEENNTTLIKPYSIGRIDLEIANLGFVNGRKNNYTQNDFNQNIIIENNLSDVKLFPNPTSGILKIEIKTETKLQVFNLSGQKIQEKMLTENQNKISLPTKGIYLIRLSNEEGTYTEKVIVQ